MIGALWFIAASAFAWLAAQIWGFGLGARLAETAMLVSATILFVAFVRIGGRKE